MKLARRSSRNIDRNTVPLFGPAARTRTTPWRGDRKSTRLNSSHLVISYAVFCLKKKNLRRRGVASRAPRAPSPTPPVRVLGNHPRDIGGALVRAHARYRRSRLQAL